MASPACFQALPRAVELSRERRGEETAERPGHAGRGGLEPHRPVPPKVEYEAGVAGEAFEDPHVRGMRRRSVVRQNKTAESLPNLYRAPPVGPGDDGGRLVEAAYVLCPCGLRGGLD